MFKRNSPGGQAISAETAALSRSGLAELTSGIDALYVSVRGAIAPNLLERLDQTRQFATSLNLSVPFEFGGEAFRLAPYGFGKYRYCLENEIGRIGITPSSHLPTVRIQPRAELLHGIGPEATIARLQALLLEDIAEPSFSTSRIDLFVDLQGWEVHSIHRDRFVCRADLRRSFERHGKLTGLQFGVRTTKTFSARIYDKTADITVRGTDWWLEIWRPRFNPELPVTRIEFELGREGLKQMGVSSPIDVLASTGDLWRYCAGEWLTYRQPTTDSTRSRWPIAEEWRAVQAALLTENAIGLQRMRAGQTAGSIRKLVPALTGYLVAAAVALETNDLSGTVTALEPHIRSYERRTRRDFRDRVAQRQMEVTR